MVSAAGPGQMTAVLGANGVGKSTLLKAIFGFLEPAGGHVRLDGTEITGTPPHRMVERGVAYGPQQPGIFAEMTVEDYVATPADNYKFMANMNAPKAADGPAKPAPTPASAPATTPAQPPKP